MKFLTNLKKILLKTKKRSTRKKFFKIFLKKWKLFFPPAYNVANVKFKKLNKNLKGMIYMNIQLKVMSADAWMTGNTQSIRYVKGVIRYLDAITGANLAGMIEVGQMTQYDEAITYDDCTVAITHLAKYNTGLPIRMEVSKRAMNLQSKDDLFQIIAHEYAHAWHHEADIDSWMKENARDDEGHGDDFKAMCQALGCTESDDCLSDDLMERLDEDSEWLDDYLIVY